MKKFLLLVAAVFACAMGMAAQQTLTVHDGEATNGMVPIYGYYCDNFLKCEFVMPADELQAMKGKDIKQLKWYLSEAPSSYSGNGWNGTNFQIFMKEVEETTLSAYTGLEGATVVFEGSFDPTGQTELSIEFANPYSYNGGNLLIGVYNTVMGAYMSASFVGESVTGACVQGYSGSSLAAISATQRGFIPKTTFTYGDPLPYAAAVTPASLDFGKVYPGESKALNVKVKNNGLNAFTPAVTVATPFSSTYEAAELAAGAEVEIPVTFAPTTVGDYTANLTVNCGEAGEFTVALSGLCSDELELVVCDGTATSSYTPFYGTYYDTEDTRTQMIYPADMLTDLVGAEILGIKFHPRYNINFTDGKLQVSVGETETNAFTLTDGAIENPVTGLTTVASLNPVSENYIWEITFNEPYKYEGGNLAVETLVTEKGTYSSTTFYGVATEDYLTFYEYDSWSGAHTCSGWKVLPKMTIVYKKAAVEPVEPVYYVVGFNDWDNPIEIGENGATVEAQAQNFEDENDTAQEFKIKTANGNDGWIWYGGEDNGGPNGEPVGYFDLKEEYLGNPITLDDAGSNFRLPSAGSYNIKLVADRAAVEGLKMVVTKETVTAIDNIKGDVKGDNNYYNLMGQKMNGNNLPAGIYIHNGKKIIVK